MSTNRPKSHRVASVGLTIVICAMLLIPIASAVTITSLPYSDSHCSQHFDYYESTVQMSATASSANGGLQLYFEQVQNYQNVHYASLEVAADLNIEEGSYLEGWYQRPSDNSYQPAILQVHKTRNTFGGVTKTVIYVYVTNWDVGTKTGAWTTYIYMDNDGRPATTPYVLSSSWSYPIAGYTKIGGNDDYRAYLRLSRSDAGLGHSLSTNSYVEGYINSRYLLSITEEGLSYNVDLTRYIEGTHFYSILSLYDKSNNLITTDVGSDNVEFMFGANRLGSLTVTIGNTVNVFNLSISTAPDPGEEPEEPEEPEKGVNKTFSVFIKDGNTYEPIDEANVSFKRYDTGEWLLNKTIYNGYASVTLPTGWYYVYVTSPGYYQPYPVQMVVDENLVSSTYRIYPAGEIPEPEEPTEFLDLTVSVKNSQTGALIGGSEIGIRRYGDTGFYQNLTLSSGYTTVFLPPGNYEIFAEAPGYYQVYPARITLDQPHENIGVFLQPTTPIPAEGNVTLNLWVCYVEPGSGQAVGIPYADILISGISGDGIGYSSGSLITDMGGYLTLDIPANTEYIAYAEKPGYLAGSTHFTVFNVSPVNMTIQMIREIPPTVPVVTPPPTIPTLPTPTEPLGFMEQSGKALGDLFGVSLSIGKMMLGVLISLAVGMGTAKNLKGGAPEFCVGFLGAAFLVTMADLIPVGFFVAMLLLMGIYIARAYFLGGENGG